jgi:catechol 2,3-dioxygenase-like lactoylglutathione lyase family enzyme
MPLKCNGYMTLLFVRDIDRARDFYQNVLGLEFEHADDNSAAFILGPDALLLLNHAGADDLLSPSAVEHDAARASSVVVTSVDDVDALYEELRAKGVEFIRAPEDRWWGKRCAHFKDPDGNVWEIHTDLD